MMRGNWETLETGFISHFTLVLDRKRITAHSGLSLSRLCWVVSETALGCLCAPSSGSVDLFFIFMLPHQCFCVCFQSSSFFQCLPLDFLIDLALQLTWEKGHLPQVTASSLPLLLTSGCTSRPPGELLKVQDTHAPDPGSRAPGWGSLNVSIF